MKEGSIALVNQITTISKIRIFDPRNLKGVLAGVSLSEESMEKINPKVKELYTFHQLDVYKRQELRKELATPGIEI